MDHLDFATIISINPISNKWGGYAFGLTNAPPTITLPTGQVVPTANPQDDSTLLYGVMQGGQYVQITHEQDLARAAEVAALNAQVPYMTDAQIAQAVQRIQNEDLHSPHVLHQEAPIAELVGVQHFGHMIA